MPPLSEPIRRLRACVLLPALACSLAAAAPRAVEPAGIVTILEGDASALQGTARTGVVEGQLLAPTAIVETGARTGLLRIETGDGTAIDLGPDTRVMLSPPGFAARGRKTPPLYVLNGWVKLSAPAVGAGIVGMVSPWFGMPSQKGVAVAFVSADGAAVFLESGQAQLVERRGGKSGATLALKNTEFYARAGADRGAVTARASPAMLERMPRAFRDTLPRRAAVFEGREVEPRPLAAPSYAELQPWLAGEPALRRPFTRRFVVRARESDFRRSLVTNMRSHPEWYPVLFPPEPEEKKNAAAPPGRAGSYVGFGR